MKNHTLITGASSGLGKELAIECARRGRNLILVALPGKGLQNLALAIRSTYRVRAVPIEADLSEPNAVEELVKQTLQQYSIDFLINNAGLGGTSPILSTSPDFIDKVILVNIRAMALLTRLLLPELIKKDHAYILNVSSMAAFSPIAYKSVYPASKAFVYSFSRALRHELKNTSVSVTVLHPGPIPTNYNVTRRIILQGFKGRLGLLSARDLAKEALDGAILEKKAMVIPGFWNNLSRLLLKILPSSQKISLLSNVIKKELSVQS